MAGASATVLVVDPEDTTRTDLATHFRSSSYTVETTSDVPETLAALAQRRFDIILVDVRVGGLALLGEILRRVPEAVVVLLAAHATPAEAVEAMRAGASDYTDKPRSPRHLELLLRRLLANHPGQPNSAPPSLKRDSSSFLDSLNPMMKRTIAMARQGSAADVPILLTGEAGSGKTVLARAIHEWSSHRDGPFVAVACAALADQSAATRMSQPPAMKVVGSGTNGSADTTRLDAHGGTLLFHDVGDLSTELQAQLVRSLDNHRFRWATGDDAEIDVRVIAATKHDLEAEVHSGRFREDLFFRLNVVINVPPLRNRGEDLPALTDHLLARLAARHRSRVMRLAPDAARILAHYRWPGNVLELFSVLERAVVLATGDTITANDLPQRLLAPAPTGLSEPLPPLLTLEEMERHYIQLAIAQCTTLDEAATRLGIDPATLWRKRKRYGLS